MSTEYELRTQNVSKCLRNMNCEHKILANVDVTFTLFTKYYHMYAKAK